MRRPLPALVFVTASCGVGLLACGRGNLNVDPAADTGSGGANGSAASGQGGDTSSGSGTQVGPGPGSGPGSSGSNGSGSSGSNGSGSTSSGSSGNSSSGNGNSSSSGSGSTNGSSGSMTTTTQGSTGSGQMICPGFGDACTDCASLNCAQTWCGCVNEPDCLALFQCFEDCNGDGMCESQCLSTHQDGINHVILVSGCAGTTCQPQCMWGDAGFDDCQECIYNDCAAEMNACLANPDCSALWNCLDTCDDLDLVCQSQCYQQFPGAPIQALTNALQCIVNSCQNEC